VTQGCSNLVPDTLICQRQGQLHIIWPGGEKGGILHPRVLRELAEVIAEPLSVIYQCSLLTGESQKTGGLPM